MEQKEVAVFNFVQDPDFEFEEAEDYDEREEWLNQLLADKANLEAAVGRLYMQLEEVESIRSTLTDENCRMRDEIIGLQNREQEKDAQIQNLVQEVALLRGLVLQEPQPVLIPAVQEPIPAVQEPIPVVQEPQPVAIQEEAEIAEIPAPQNGNEGPITVRKRGRPKRRVGAKCQILQSRTRSGLKRKSQNGQSRPPKVAKRSPKHEEIAANCNPAVSQYGCTCGKQFPMRKGLKSHIRIHVLWETRRHFSK